MRGHAANRSASAAKRILKRQGYTIVAHGDRGKIGEIDLVAVDDRTVVFVEEETRRSHQAGHPAEAANDQKQRQLTRLALAFLKRINLLEYAARFDVVSVTWPDDTSKPTVKHTKSTFQPAGRGQMFS